MDKIDLLEHMGLKALHKLRTGNWLMHSTRRSAKSRGMTLISEANAEWRQFLTEAGKLRKRMKYKGPKYPKVIYG